MLKPTFFGLLFYLAAVLWIADAQITKSSFSCDGRVSGYYADVGAGCQVYHMCDGLGRKFSFACPNATLFQQRMLICDHWFMVNCSKSESEYGANLLIGQKGTPFVGESGQSSFQRTPRPDYATGDSEKNNAIYHNKIDPSEDSNLVGVNSDDEQSGGKQYNLPSHWSTEYNKVAPTADPKEEFSRRQDVTEVVKIEQNTRPTLIDRLSNNVNKQNEDVNKVPVNFESRYKATTPVYPKFVDESLQLNNIDLAPPKTQPGITTIEDINNLQHQGSSEKTDSNSVPVNFESHFKATTPVYPTFVDEDLKNDNFELSPPAQKTGIDKSEIEKGDQNESADEESKKRIHVNFESNFKATTPVYPTSVDENLKRNNLELSPPLISSDTNGAIKIHFVSNFEATTPVYPLSVEATSPIPDQIGLLPPLGDVPKQGQQIVEITTRIPVNFESNFAATIPNYPTSVEPTSPSPDVVGLLPPIKNDPSGRYLNFQPKEDVNQKETDSPGPSQYYEPPLFGTGYVDPNGALSGYLSRTKHIDSPKIDDWNELRRRFSVPDYEFPLDSAAHRVGYESDLSSFQPRPAGLQKR